MEPRSPQTRQCHQWTVSADICFGAGGGVRASHSFSPAGTAAAGRHEAETTARVRPDVRVSYGPDNSVRLHCSWSSSPSLHSMAQRNQPCITKPLETFTESKSLAFSFGVIRQLHGWKLE